MMVHTYGALNEMSGSNGSVPFVENTRVYMGITDEAGAYTTV
jgi:hypothetical protein